MASWVNCENRNWWKWNVGDPLTCLLMSLEKIKGYLICGNASGGTTFKCPALSGLLCKANKILRTSEGENSQQTLVCLGKWSVQSSADLQAVMWLHYRDLIVENVNRSWGWGSTMLSFCLMVCWMEGSTLISTVYAACAEAAWHQVSLSTHSRPLCKISIAPPTPYPCCFSNPCDIASSLNKHWKLLWRSEFCQHALFRPPCQAISSHEFPALLRGEML